MEHNISYCYLRKLKCETVLSFIEQYQWHNIKNYDILMDRTHLFNYNINQEQLRQLTLVTTTIYYSTDENKTRQNYLNNLTLFILH